MKLKKMVLVVWIFFLLCSHSAVAHSNHRVAWLVSGKQSGFWPVVEMFCRAAAEDLNIELQTYYYGNNAVNMVKIAGKILSGKKPDAVMFHNYKKMGKEVLELCEKNKVPAFVFNAGFSSDLGVGAPRERYKYWIGQMLPDDEYAGYLLARVLIREAEKIGRNGPNKKIHMVALEGIRASNASNLRVKGLKRALRETDKIKFHQYFHSKWKTNLAQEAFKMSVERYPDVSVFWAASESMAIGVIRGAALTERKPGSDFVVGGIDLLPHNQKFLESGQMTVSVGGHYIEGAWVLVLLHDFFSGYDFYDLVGSRFYTKMAAITQDQIHKYGNLSATLTEDNIRKIDFTKFSRAHYPNIEEYCFNFQDALNQLLKKGH